MSKQMLSNRELTIMQCVWSREKAPTQGEIMRWVNEQTERKLDVSTYATYIRRIMWKGYLEKVDIGDGHPTYKALVSAEEYYKAELEAFRKRWGMCS